MSEKWIILAVNRFEDAMDAASGPYTEDKALEVLKEIHQGIIDEWENDNVYEGATLNDSNLDFGYFNIKWPNGTCTDYTMLKLG